MIDCHYHRLSADGEFQVFESTDGTRSNWDPEIQHGSPPLALMTKLIEEARRRGLKEMEGFVLTQNAPMLRLAKRLGFSVEYAPGEASVRICRMTLDRP